MKKLLCVLLSALMIISTLITTSAAEISEAVSATPDSNYVSATSDEAETQPIEGYCDGFYYTVLEDGTAKITDYDGDETDLTIPDMINGYVVTRIGDNAFYRNKLASVFVPESVKMIESYAFGWCKSLTSVILSEGLEGMGYAGVFDGCESLEAIVLPSTLKGLAFTQTFRGCKKLKNVTIKNGLNSIGWNCFEDCESLENLFIPESVEWIDSGAFVGCYSLNNITVAENNPEYLSEDGILFDKNKSEIVVFPKAREGSYTTPYGIVQILGCAFEDCNKLTEVVISEGVEKIGYNAFKDCFNLKSVTVSKSVEEMLYNEWNLSFGYYNKEKIEDFILYGYSGTIVEKYAQDTGIEFVSLGVGKGVYADFHYNVLNDNTIKITKYDGDINTVTIPEILNGYTVTEISYNAFSDCENLEIILLPKTVVSFDISDSSQVSSLVEINVNEDNPNYCSIDGVLYSKDVTQMIYFPFASSITDLVIPETVTSVNCSLEYCKNLKNISISKNLSYFYMNSYFLLRGDNIENIFVDEENQFYYSKNGIMYSKKTNNVFAYPQNNRTKTFEIPEGIETIDSYWYLRDCNYLENVIVPASLTNFNSAGLAYCENLKNIYVNKNNPDFCDIDGLLYNKNKTRLIRYPHGRDDAVVELPESTEEIGQCAFYKCNQITGIIIPQKLIALSGSAFIKCENLRDFTFAKSIQSISGIGFVQGGNPGAGGWILGDIDNVTIRGYNGTAAETYALEHGFTFVSLGDVENTLGDTNNDGKVSVMDATEIQKYLVGLAQLNDIQISMSDVNGDGRVSVLDATEIQKYLVGLSKF